MDTVDAMRYAMGPLIMARHAKEAIPVAWVDPIGPSASLSASCPKAIEIALDLAAGARPDVSWCCGTDTGTAYVEIGARTDGPTIILGFALPVERDFLVETMLSGYFNLVVEGMIPVAIPARGNVDALGPFLRHMGALR